MLALRSLGVLVACCVMPLGATVARAAPAERAWITLPTQLLDAARLEVAPDAAIRLGATEAEADGVAAIAVAADELPALAELAHARRGRCGGFVRHASRAEAVAALRPAPRIARRAPLALDQPELARALIDAVREPDLLATIESLSAFPNRFHAAPSGTEAAMWLRDRWLAYAAGRDDIAVELVPHEGTPQPSVLMTVIGASLPDEIIVVGAHLDSIARGGVDADAPGADDDASGVAVVTELARLLAATGYRPARTLRLYAYAAEEIGLVGSREIARATAARGDDVIAALQLDMTNYRGSDIDLTLVDDFTDPATTQLLADVIDAYLDLDWEYDRCGYACSDHASWTAAGFAAAHPFEARSRDINPTLHTPQDTLAVSNYTATHAAIFARIAAGFAAELAEGSLATGASCDDAPACPDGSSCRDGVCVPDDAPPSPDAGPAGPGPGADPATTAGCGCRSAPATGAALGWLSLLTLPLLGRRRRR